MSLTIDVTVPDLGDFDSVDVIEVLVSPGDQVELQQSLITLESDKASMEIPSTHAGRVESLAVSVGDKVSEGAVILTLAVAGAEPDVTRTAAPAAESESPTDKPPAVETGTGPTSAAATIPPTTHLAAAQETAGADFTAEVVVLGAGPGGYTAAFRAADLGKQVVLVERYPTLGGVCLNVGCIPSKALLHAASVIEEAAYFARHGIRFGAPEIEITALASWKDGVVKRLTRGLSELAAQRKVTVLTGTGRFTSPHRLEVTTQRGTQSVAFQHAIIAAGSHAADVPGVTVTDPRIMHSTGALALEDVPARLLVIGGGVIGLELATVYSAIGSRVTVVEATEGLMPGCDRDLLRPLERRIRKAYDAIHLRTRVTAMQPGDDGVHVTIEGKDGTQTEHFDRVLVAVGRRANGGAIDADRAGVTVNEVGVITVDAQQRTSAPHIFAIGDIVGEPMLAHKATHEAKVAAEVIAGMPSRFDARVIPSVAYTDPEVAWVGVSEADAKRDGLEHGTGVFPWAASGRALAMGREEGLTKIVFDRTSGRVIGAGIVGVSAGDLISELALAIEMGADAQDIALTVHPHPTLSETVAMAAEAFEGTITDLYLPKK
jgi:dihydrolipoamide dehydrogenase